MMVPAHNLYDFIHHALEKRYCLYYFYPWGSRDLDQMVSYQLDLEHIEGINGLSHVYSDMVLGDAVINKPRIDIIQEFQPIVLCHDQEPLDFSNFQTQVDRISPPMLGNILCRPKFSWQKKWILLHSELRSQEVEKYESTGLYAGAYWWSHAVLARDWYRFAATDPRLDYPRTHKKIFLIYARESTGSRTYRNQFLQELQGTSAGPQSQIGSFDGKAVNSDASAIYNAEDFLHSDISIVCETVFDQRVHLTEKVLRPLACGHPFMVLAGPGTLRTLRGYGFKTFDPWIRESYDEEISEAGRMDLVLREMQRLSEMSWDQRQELLAACQQICQHNRQHFFSDKFFTLLTDELRTNVTKAYETYQGHLTPDFMWRIQVWRRQNDVRDVKSLDDRRTWLPLIRHLRSNRGNPAGFRIDR